ncbi:MAG: DUF6502 family protein [Halieaceae bacterium]|jgi:hypothetical protein|nr:DUF6502 family protein [Halieaceae bacterium]
MTTNAQTALRLAVFRLMRPLARVMLRHGMAYGSFAELARKAYVDEALAILRGSGKRASISSVAAMTGLTRKEASRLASLDLDSSEEADQRYNRAVRVISAWVVDPRFQGRDGQPKPLPLEGDGSFAELVKDFSGDVPTAAMLTTLESSGTVQVRDNQVELLRKAYVPTQTPVASLNILGKDTAELLSTIDHNLGAAPEQRVFQRKVSNASLQAGALQTFRELSNRKSQELLEEYDAWLKQHEINSAHSDADDACYVAVGIYYFDQTLIEETSDEHLG